MSKDNKVNRDHYTQRGRLTPDDAARELAKQRQAASPKKAEGSKFGEPDAPKVKARVTDEDKIDEDEDDTK
jgi:hypothetical protein